MPQLSESITFVALWCWSLHHREQKHVGHLLICAEALILGTFVRYEVFRQELQQCVLFEAHQRSLHTGEGNFLERFEPRRPQTTCACQVFGTPRNHPKSKPFHDHIMCFYWPASKSLERCKQLAASELADVWLTHSTEAGQEDLVRFPSLARSTLKIETHPFFITSSDKYFPCQAKPPRFSSRFRHYQISPETPEDANKPEKQAKALLKHCQCLAKDCRSYKVLLQFVATLLRPPRSSLRSGHDLSLIPSESSEEASVDKLCALRDLRSTESPSLLLRCFCWGLLNFFVSFFD